MRGERGVLIAVVVEAAAAATGDDSAAESTRPGIFSILETDKRIWTVIL